MEKHAYEVRPWWRSARTEVTGMAYAVPLLFADVGAPFCPYIYATDAMGANETDNGGFGIVGAELPQHMLYALIDRGEHPGRTVARLGGELTGLKHPEREIIPTVPFTRLPQELFDGTVKWSDIQSGRWRYADHITLGEARTVVRLCQLLAREPTARRHVIFSLQDNQPCAGSMTKGRSPSAALNYLLRKKAALCIASLLRLLLPWVESAKQPADLLSRIQ